MMLHPDLERSLLRHRRRRSAWLVARGLAITLVCALLVTAGAVALGNRAQFEARAVHWLGVGVYVATICIALLALATPWLRSTRARAIRALERHLPVLSGRIETYAEQAAASPPSPLLPLLADDALKQLQPHAPSRIWPTSWIASACAVGLAALVCLGWLGSGGGGVWGEGARRIWGLGKGFAEPSLAVSPRDLEVLRGTPLRVELSSEGFTPSTAQIHVRREGSAAEESASMQRTADDRFEFLFAAVEGPFTYRVSTGKLSSETYAVSVLDAPRLERLTLRYVYPEWTGRAPVEVDPGTDIRALRDTRVEIRAITDPPLESGVLVVDSLATPLSVRDGVARADLTVRDPAVYHLAAHVAGQQVRLTPELRIFVEPDAEPLVEILKPGRDRTATMIEEVTTRIRAQDDVRLEAFDLHVSINGGDWIRRPLPAKGARGEAGHVFFLEELAASEGLTPGDVITYYASARDHTREVRTELSFIDVRPFDQSFSQSQQAAPPGGGGEAEISMRQRQMVIATWNLLRDAEQVGAAELEDRAALLARLQRTLQQQTQTLVERVRARGLGGGDGELERFVSELAQATSAMGEASERLGALELQAALPPEQQALQRLLRAEAQLRERQVSMQGSSEPSDAQAATRDLAELIELEMDLEKNVYEVGERASEPRTATDPELERAFEELEQLAARQQRLADELKRAPQQTLAQRWQQETLRREAEELRRRLAQRQDANAQALARSLESASSEMERALDDWQAQGSSAAQGVERARRELKQALAAESERRTERSDASLAEIPRRASELVDRQQEAAGELRSRALLDTWQGEAGALFDREQIDAERELARERRELREQIVDLAQEAESVASELRESSPDAARTLSQAVTDLEETQLRERMAFAEELIERGEGAFVIPIDEDALRALGAFRDAAERAARIGSDAGDRGREPDLDAWLAELRELRTRLGERAASGAQPAAQSRPGAAANAWAPPPNPGDTDPRRRAQIESELEDAAQAARRIAGRMRAAGMTPPSTSAAASSGSSGDLAARLRDRAVELEQLELVLQAERDPRSAVPARAVGDAEGRSERSEVADYYRSLSRQDPAARTRATE